MGTIIKVIVTLTWMGMLYSIYFFPRIPEDKKKLKKALQIFIAIWLILLLIAVIEFNPYAFK